MRGFTLTEVLVALSVFAMAAMALLHAQGENLRTSQALTERSFALMVAENRLVEVMAVRGQIPNGQTTGIEIMANRSWAWERQIGPTQNPNVIRIDVTVFAEGEDGLLAQLSGFRGVR